MLPLLLLKTAQKHPVVRGNFFEEYLAWQELTNLDE